MSAWDRARIHWQSTKQPPGNGSACTEYLFWLVVNGGWLGRPKIANQVPNLPKARSQVHGLMHSKILAAKTLPRGRHPGSHAVATGCLGR